MGFWLHSALVQSAIVSELLAKSLENNKYENDGGPASLESAFMCGLVGREISLSRPRGSGSHLLEVKASSL